MTETTNLFDIENISDLPKELIRELRLTHNVDQMVFSLFIEAKKQLNLTELLVAWFRKYNKIRSRQYMMTTCYRLYKKGLLKKGKNKGSYVISKKAVLLFNGEAKCKQ